MRAHWRAAARGLPRRNELLALPRQRFDAVEQRLARALLANARAHGLRLARAGVRLSKRLVVARVAGSHDRLEAHGRRLATALARVAGPRRARLERVAGRLAPAMLVLRFVRARELLDRLEDRRRTCMRARLAGWHHQLESCTKLLASLSHQGVLRRGFAVVRDARGRPVRVAAAIRVGQRLDVEFADGRVGVQALEGRGARQRVPAGTKRGPCDGGSQGSLF
jgi:exodeoxyribonuclease VII large subunit